jgi:hypothetical protein
MAIIAVVAYSERLRREQQGKERGGERKKERESFH